VNGELAFSHVGFVPEAVPYLAGWELQRQVHQRRAAGEIPDTCLLLEHQSVYTAGKRTSRLDRPAEDPGIPVIDVDRGGKITWHGPGQLVGYPIVKLAEPVDVIAYVRSIEDALIRACADVGVATTRVEGRSGVWVTGATTPAGGSAPARDAAPAGGDTFRSGRGNLLTRPGGQRPTPRQDRKVAAIGIRVSRGVTTHGFALNCDCDLTWFDRIVPCGIADAGVTSLSAEAGRRITVAGMVPIVEKHLTAVLGATPRHRPAPASELTAAAR
jgi:lipoyl(octanoyl) transferase